MSIKSFIAIFLILAAFGYAYYSWRSQISSFLNPSKQAIESESSKLSNPEKPVEKYPVNRNSDSTNSLYPVTKKLPTMQESDSLLRAELTSLFGKDHFENVFVSEDLIGHFVMTIVNAQEKKIPSQLLPFTLPQGKFLVSGSGEAMQIDSRNYDRYSPYVALLQIVDLKKLVALYTWLYPLFQEAYSDLGTDGFFNDKVISVLDAVVATPEIKEPILVVKPVFYYQFADPELESLPAIQKFIQRMGPGNAGLVKTKAKELRRVLSHLNQ